MAYGFSFVNIGNSKSIDENYSNFSEVSSGTIASRGALPVLSGNQILLVRPATGGGTLRATRTSTIACSSGNIEYSICNILGTSSSNSWGLRVFRADGTIAYDSGYKNLSLATQLSFTRIDNGAVEWSTAVSIPVGKVSRKRYVLAGQLRLIGWAGEPGSYVPMDFISLRLIFSNGNISSMGFSCDNEYAGPIIVSGTTKFWASGQINFSICDI